MQQDPAQSAGWQAFLSNPAAYADAARLVPCFDGSIDEAACLHMLGLPRLHGRLSAILNERYGLSLETAPPADDIDRAIALASGEALEDIALRSGAIYWAGSLASVIAGRQAAALQAALGADAYAFALANRDLTGPLRPIGPLEDVHGLVYEDGLRCLGAWGQSLSGDTGMRVRLKLMPHALIDQKADEAFVKTGPAIVRRAMGP